MIKITRILNFIMLASLAFLACKDKDQSGKGDVIAEYEGHFLYRSDLPDEVRNSPDSVAAIKQFADKWLENTIMVSEAEAALSDEQKDNEKLIEEYRNSLLIYQYQQHLIREKLDTSVTDAEIRAFYDENKAAFQLKKNIVKIRYVKIRKQNADIGKIKRWMQDTDPKSDVELRNYAEKQAENFYTDSNWLYLDDIIREIPLNQNYDQQRFLSNNKFIQIEENDILYLLYIIDFRIKDAISPIDFEKDRIRDIILYQRKLNFLRDKKKALFDAAVKNGKAILHTDNKQ